MHTSKHTPGPWHARLAPNNKPYVAAENRANVVSAGAVSKVDAVLIAAAPELLAALHEMLADQGEHSIGCKELPPGYDDSKCCPVHIARAAIAKAEGAQ